MRWFAAICCSVSLLGSAVAAEITFNGTLRDFKMRGTDGGHPDFEWFISGHSPGMVATTLPANNRPVYVGTSNFGAVTDASTFDQWYQDVNSINQSMPYSITLNNNANPNVYRFSSHDLPGGAFFPLDGLLFGNQGLNHNYSFTYAINGTFVYQPGQFFGFTGDDDVWVFINNQLAVDLGGVHGELGASVNLNTLGLTPGNTYDFDFYFAERHTTDSNFTMELNFEVVPEPATVGAMVVGLAALIRRRRR